MWGFFPLYFKLLAPVPAAGDPGPPGDLVGALRQPAAARHAQLALPRPASLRDRRLLGGITLAAVLIGVNWGDLHLRRQLARVVETALGYFITPLVVVLLGVTVQRERLRPWQWVAVGIGAVAVAVLTVDYGHLPYIALMLAASFGVVQLDQEAARRCRRPRGCSSSRPCWRCPRWRYLDLAERDRRRRVRARLGRAHGADGLSGVATAVPLLLFAGAANRVPLVGLGILQYVAPILQLGLRGADLPRADAAGPAGRLRAGLAGADHLHRGRPARRPAARAERQDGGRSRAAATAEPADRPAATLTQPERPSGDVVGEQRPCRRCAPAPAGTGCPAVKCVDAGHVNSLPGAATQEPSCSLSSSGP